jgi:hypothetical protein
MGRVQSTRLIAVLGLVAALGPVSGCGDDDGGGSALTSGEEARLEIDPESGPPGTKIEWMLSGCEEKSEKSIAIYVGTPAGKQGEVVASPGAVGSRGSIIVPKDVTHGPLTVSVLCSSPDEQREPPFEMEVANAEFELTEPG